MRPVIVSLAVLATTLAGCATVAPMDSTDAPIRYSCKAGKRFTAAYALHGKRVVVTAGGATKTLNLARSASGARYAAGDAEIWSKGPDAMGVAADVVEHPHPARLAAGRDQAQIVFVRAP